MLLSAIMPAFNAESYVTAAIRAVLNQTIDNWELVIVDDGSTDNTNRICRSFADQDNRIKLFTRPHGGRAVARNSCLEQASGEVVVICDADDISFPERFTTHADHFRSTPNLGISTATVQIVFYDDLDIRRMHYFKYDNDADTIRRRLSQNRMAISNSSSAISRRVFDTYGVFDPRLLRCQDYEFYRRVVQGVSIRCTRTPMVLYRANQTLSKWGYFWESRRYHWIVDNLPTITSAGSLLPSGDLPSPSLSYHAITFARFGKYLVRSLLSRQRGLNRPDQRRVSQLLESVLSSASFGP